jgi:hypothetical protein
LFSYPYCRSNRFFGKLPAKQAGGPIYAASPMFKFHDEITFDNGINEYPSNYLSSLKFPQMDQPFIKFQKGILHEVIRRCYEGKDIAGFLEVRFPLSP